MAITAPSTTIESPQTGSEPRFLRACRRQPVDATPIWLMRQAGRYMPEYQALRQRYSFGEIIKTPELACAVTLQPIDAFGVDAAIIFADTLPPLASMGLQVEFGSGAASAPQIGPLIRSAADVDRLRIPVPEEDLGFTLDAIRLTRRELERRNVPLIGFCGAPFTLASYAIEGCGSGSRGHLHVRTKELMLSQPVVWHRLMTKLSEMAGRFLVAQAQAGAQALCIFDSRVDVLSPADYREYVLPYTSQVVASARQADVPIIAVGTNTSGSLELTRELACDVIALDWRIDLDVAWQRLGFDQAVQGNLDPLALFAPWPELRRRAQQILEQAAGRPGHIFNLGAPIVPCPPVENVRRLVEFVHQYSTLQQVLLDRPVDLVV